ncbi:hypothetical protein HBH64_047200 [Parastagonospora nodorum]|nr:hypothetical protein HBH47_172470 [Parastagonospora nodorum]KAH4299365.1 hypothetical protein HBI02_153320 [Parastagonospora nodorum]KAH4301177.1 hypothetical protein HBI01_101860 [Parastagonospora nodorum]KAH4319442.1 hypothetical protein HBI00_245350 [Parastagonospora nodorum]KAH4365843.1 hypothetical protein HBH94_156430 [Parastagonospora nodorum]
MVWAWQEWLSPRPKQRTITTTQTAFPHLGDAALYEPLSKPNGLWVIRETHYIKDPIVKAGLSGPPIHLHLTQDEFFKIEQGVLGAVKDGVEYAVTKDDGVFCIPKGTRHRFWSHKSGTEDLVFTVWLDPCTETDHLFDVNILRNLTGYMNDCKKLGVALSPWQLLLFFEDASSILIPPALSWMPNSMLTWVHHGLAWYAESVLGYKRTYPEYVKES